MPWRLRKAKANWIGCCNVIGQGATWLAQCYSLNLNFSFFNRISLLLISSSYSIVLMRLSGPHSRPKVGIKIPDPAKNQTWAASMEGSDSANYTMAAD